MMRVAIIGGTGVYSMMGGEYGEQIENTPYGPAKVLVGSGDDADIIFLPRHGPEHHIPPHMINFRANIAALQQLGVERVLAIFTVGSINPDMQPGDLVLLDQFLDFTSGRPLTFFDGGDSGLVHAEVSHPYCENLRNNLTKLADEHGLAFHPKGTYVCANGPRFETPAEIRMYGKVGGDVVGMTGVPEVVLAREKELHYAAVAQSVNWAAGVQPKINIYRDGVEEVRKNLLRLFVAALRRPFETTCECKDAAFVMHPPKS